MYSAQQIANETLGAHQRGVVECEKCHSPIVIRQPGMVSVEFSVPCPKCGHRGMYFKRMIYSEDTYERRKSPRS